MDQNLGHRHRAARLDIEDVGELRRLIAVRERCGEDSVPILERLIDSGRGTYRDLCHLQDLLEERGLSRREALELVVARDPRHFDLLRALMELSEELLWGEELLSWRRAGWTVREWLYEISVYNAMQSDIRDLEEALDLMVSMGPRVVPILIEEVMREHFYAFKLLARLGFQAQAALPYLEEKRRSAPRPVRRAAKNAVLSIQRAVRGRAW